jgi:hypothetical protein
MIMTKMIMGGLLTVLLIPLAAPAQDSSSLPYDQKMDVVYGEVHGTGLLMDVFTPKGKANGLGIVDVVSGNYNSDRRKIRDHILAQVYSIFCSHGYTVFAVRPGSRTRYTAPEMEAHVKTGIRYVKQHAVEYKIDPDRLGLTGASAGGHLATLAAVTPEEGNPNADSPLLRQNTRVKAAAVFFPPTDFLDWDGKPADFKTLGDLLFLGGAQGHSEGEIKERAAQISPARLVLKQASWESSWAAWTLPLEFRPEISAPASRMASMTCLWAAVPCWHVAEWFLNPFLARASDTASVHCARPKPHGHYPLALTGAICRIRSHVAKKSFNQLLYPRIR